jgi:ribonuclease BN (tRNA processing enzyme)
MRIEGGGRVIGYSADTGPAWSLAALGPGLDLAVCEATFLREQEGVAQHLSGRQAGASAREAGARRLLLTHIWPTIDPERSRAEATAAYGGHVDVAVTNERYEL